jgi:dCTP deaminase
MILNDSAISKLAENDILMPYCGEKRRVLNDGRKAVSYGLSQCGYDIRLSPKQFLVFDNSSYQPMDYALDPKEETNAGWEAALVHGERGSFFELPPQSFGLGLSLELFNIPEDVFILFTGKSTYARLGLIVNVTPAEPGWSGFLTMNFINPTPFAIRLYSGEGIAQAVFFNCGKVAQAYTGQYQNQGEVVTTSKVG